MQTQKKVNICQKQSKEKAVCMHSYMINKHFVHTHVHLHRYNMEMRDRKRHPLYMSLQTMTYATNTNQFCDRGRANCNTQHPSITTHTIDTHNQHDCYTSPRDTRGTLSCGPGLCEQLRHRIRNGGDTLCRDVQGASGIADMTLDCHTCRARCADGTGGRTAPMRARAMHAVKASAECRRTKGSHHNACKTGDRREHADKKASSRVSPPGYTRGVCTYYLPVGRNRVNEWGQGP